MRKLYMILSLSLVTVFAANGQAFYNAGTVTVEGTGLLYVDGDVEVANTGAITNDGVIEIKGNYTNNRTDGAIANGASGERLVKFTGTSLQDIIANNSSSVSFHSLQITNSDQAVIGGFAIRGVNTSGVSVTLTGELDLGTTGGITLASGDLTLGVNATVVNYNSVANARFSSGSFNKKVVSGQPSTVHTFPYYKGDFNGGTYLPAVIRLNSAPVQADEIRVKFEANSNIGTIFHVGGCSNIGPLGSQNIMLNRMVEDFGVWRIDAEDASNNNLDNVAGWEYDVTLYPTASALSNLSSTYGSDYYKLLRIPSHDGSGNLLPAPTGSTDWSNAPTQSGTYCNGIVEIGAYNQSTGITATKVNYFSRFGGAGNEGGASLPIELIGLEAVPVDNQYIAVNWATSIEIDNKGFEVLRSTNGEDFTVQGWVDGNGSSTVQHNYNFIDRNVVPNQLYYYRLRQVDNDNNSELTYIVNAMITGSTVFTVSDFIPNPSHSNTRIEIVSSDVKNVKVVIYNTLGQIISSQEVNTAIGTTPIHFDMSEVAAGTYYGVITVDGEEFNKKLVISRQ